MFLLIIFGRSSIAWLSVYRITSNTTDETNFIQAAASVSVEHYCPPVLPMTSPERERKTPHEDLQLKIVRGARTALFFIRRPAPNVANDGWDAAEREWVREHGLKNGKVMDVVAEWRNKLVRVAHGLDTATGKWPEVPPEAGALDRQARELLETATRMWTSDDIHRLLNMSIGRQPDPHGRDLYPGASPMPPGRIGHPSVMNAACFDWITRYRLADRQLLNNRLYEIITSDEYSLEQSKGAVLRLVGSILGTDIGQEMDSSDEQVRGSNKPGVDLSKTIGPLNVGEWKEARNHGNRNYVSDWLKKLVSNGKGREENSLYYIDANELTTRQRERANDIIAKKDKHIINGED